jgi:hypothetical protein
VSAERLLLVRGAGSLWGIAHAAVRMVTRLGSGYRVELAEHAVAADQVVGVVEGLNVRPAGGVLARFWSEAAGGLAVHGDTPLVVIDPDRPPSILRPESTETSDADESREPSD